MFYGGGNLSTGIDVIGVKQDVGRFNIEERARKLAGIIRASREIHIYQDLASVNNGCRVVLINRSTSLSGEIIFDNPHNPYNGTMNYVGVYNFVGYLDISGLRKNDIESAFKGGTYNLVSVRRMMRDSDFDNQMTFNGGVNLYSDKYSDDIDSTTGTLFEDDISIVPPPLYYTKEHEYQINGEVLPFNVYSSNVLSDNNYGGFDLIDDVTSIYYHKDTGIESKLKQDSIDGVKDDIASEVLITIDDTTKLDTIIQGGILIYGSDMSGVAIRGNPHIKNRDTLTEEGVRSEVDELIEDFLVVCKEIESNHGNVGIIYNPSLTGNSIKVNLRDYENGDDMIRDFDSNVEVSEVVGLNIDRDRDLMESGDSIWYDDGYNDGGGWVDYPYSSARAL